MAHAISCGLDTTPRRTTLKVAAVVVAGLSETLRRRRRLEYPKENIIIEECRESIYVMISVGKYLISKAVAKKLEKIELY